MIKWKSIESAPKDGTLILLADDPSMPVVPGFYNEAQKNEGSNL